MDAKKAKTIVGYVFGVVACLALGAAVGWNLSKGGTKQTHVNLKFGEHQLEVKLDQEQIDAETFLGNIFDVNFSKSGALEWLKSKQQVYHFEDIDLVQEFQALEPDHPVSEQLFKLSTQKIGPWAYQVDTVQISIPERKFQPNRGSVNVCENGKYLGRNLIIYNLDQSTQINVEATGKYACPTGLNYPHLQLHAKDARQLLGHDNFSKYETAIVLIVQD